MRALTSSIGRKVQVALTGLLLCGFLVAHLAGNLLIYAGMDDFNHYAEALEGNPLLPAAEAGLAVLFLLHIATTLWLKIENKAARPVPYVQYHSAGGRSPGSATMIFSGLVLLVFLVVHIKTFRLVPEAERENLYQFVLDAFSSKGYSLFYVAAMFGLGLHLSHGFQSGFQTLGLNHPKYSPWIKGAGWAFAAVVAAGFASIPLWGAFLQKACCAIIE